jgi:hypothetical protein
MVMQKLRQTRIFLTPQTSSVVLLATFLFSSLRVVTTLPHLFTFPLFYHTHHRIPCSSHCKTIPLVGHAGIVAFENFPQHIVPTIQNKCSF